MVTNPAESRGTVKGDGFRATYVPGVVIVRWFDNCEPEDYPRVTRFMVDSAKANRGSIDFVSIVCPMLAIPTQAQRRAITDFVNGIRDSIDVTYIVFIGGGGFWQTIVRSLTTGYTTLTGKHGKVCHDISLEATLARVCAKHGHSAAQLRASLESEGFLT